LSLASHLDCRAALVASLAKGHAQGRLEERLITYIKPKLLIIDELGYLPLEPDATHLFFQLVSRRCERGAILITSNRSVGEWGTVFRDAVVATAILDRLLTTATSSPSAVTAIHQRQDRERRRNVKKNAVAGRCFATYETFEAHLDVWTREVADIRIHGTTGEVPIARFAHAEAKALKPISGIPPFRATRELIRARYGAHARGRKSPVLGKGQQLVVEHHAARDSIMIHNQCPSVVEQNLIGYAANIAKALSRHANQPSWCSLRNARTCSRRE
jgi:hypothetical protein